MSATTQAPAAYADAPIIEGLSVYTLDNKRLGSVAEVGDAYFRVHVRWRRDFWLARNQVAYVDVGARTWLAHRFILCGEYNKHVVPTDRDDNEEVDEWKLGFPFFF